MSNNVPTEKNKDMKPDVPMEDYEQTAQNFQSALGLVDDMVMKNYVSHLADMAVIPLDETMKSNFLTNTRLFKITEMVYEKDEFSAYKLASVFNSLLTAQCAVFILMDSDGRKTDFYLGVTSYDPARTSQSLAETLDRSLHGQFPGTKTENCDAEWMENLQEELQEKAANISSVTCIANSKDEEDHKNVSFIQGLEKLAIAMQGERYTGMIIANGTTADELQQLRKQYEMIYTQLAPFAKTQASWNHTDGKNLSDSESVSTSITDTIGRNWSSSTSTSSSYSKSRSYSESQNSIGKKLMGVLGMGAGAGGGTAGIIAAKAAAGKAASVAIPFAGAVTTSAVAAAASGLGVVAIGAGIAASVFGKTKTETESQSESYTYSFTTGKGGSEGHSEGQTKGNTHTKGISLSNGKTLMLNMENKQISNLLQRLDTQMKRLDEFESLGMWNCAAYFMAEESVTAEIAASTYRSLMRGEHSGVETAAVNSWTDWKNEDTLPYLRDYILNILPPMLAYSNGAQLVTVTPCAMVSGNELAIHMGLPRKSVPGFPVIEHADFGKEVVVYGGKKDGSSIPLGNIFNMGSTLEDHSVRLNKESLSMHTFVTGATGSGKSNTIYEMLDQLRLLDVHFLVVEPAKGEYKSVFGGRRDVHVFGTNPQYTELLKINPFRFPHGVHVLEHIDRLIEIFNVCWPMYAAMPAVLKDALLQAYENCGWDLNTSENRICKGLFPTFIDLQEALEDVVSRSAYSEEVKSNYLGSLATRVKSLTNGLNGQIFAADEVPEATLFDSNVIVDLSRIGSLETKSLIMGILVMRLNEYRMTSANGMNVPLKHVTVLEEAHNLLKRTTEGTGAEGANMAGKSVEMLSNAIAEMRTYGEGFIIADQSPNAVDPSAIRNTNTKIIMRLPDEDDRRIAGKSAALKDEQLDEIAKLPKGVAVVYQNDWVEPVLCKVNRFDSEEKPYVYVTSVQMHVHDSARFYNELLTLMMKGRMKDPSKAEVDIDLLEKELPYINISAKNKCGIQYLLNEYNLNKELSIWQDLDLTQTGKLLLDFLDCHTQMDTLMKSVHEWNELNGELKYLIETETGALSPELLYMAACGIMKAFTIEPPYKGIYPKWIEQVERKGGIL